MCKAKLHKYLPKEINKEVHFASGINILLQVVTKGTTVVENKENILESFFQEVLCDIFTFVIMFGSENAPIHKISGQFDKTDV